MQILFFLSLALFFVVVAPIKETGNGLREKIIPRYNVELFVLRDSESTFSFFFSFSFSFGLIFDKKVGRKKVGLFWVLWVRGANYLGVKFTLYRSLSLSLSRFMFERVDYERANLYALSKLKYLRLWRFCNSVNETHRGCNKSDSFLIVIIIIIISLFIYLFFFLLSFVI